MMKKQVTITVNGERKIFPLGTLLSEAISGEKPCGAHGKCGKCKVTARGSLSPVTDAEKQHLSAEELSQGVRLACLTAALGDCEVAEKSTRGGVNALVDGVLPSFELDARFEHYGIAVDLGTTTVAARLFNKRGDILAEASGINLQAAHGADVVSRIESALGGKGEELRTLAIRAIDGLVDELVKRGGISARDVDGAVITGNTVMLTVLADSDPLL